MFRVLMISLVLFASQANFAQATKKNETRKVAQADELRWSASGETCIFYDYRSMLEQGQPSEFYFAIEPQNYNGGSREFTYKRKDFKNAKEAYLAAFKDLSTLIQSSRCDAFSVFYPSLKQPNAPL